MRKIGLFLGALLSLLSIFTTAIAQDERAPAGTAPLEQIVYASNGRLELMTFYSDYPLTIDYLSDPNLIQVSEPEIAANGQSLAFIGVFNGQTDVFLLEASNTFRQLTDTPAVEQNLEWASTNPLSFTVREHEFSESDLVMLDIYNQTAVTLAKEVATCCHKWLNRNTVVFVPLLFEEPRQISLDEPNVLLPYDGDVLDAASIIPHAKLVLPEISRGFLVEADRSPMHELWYGIYSIWDPLAVEFYDLLVITDNHGQILVKIRGVQPGDADWRNLNGFEK